MNIVDRMERLERVVLGIAAILTGEAHAAANSPEELTQLQEQLARDMQAIAEEMK